jgi:putative colanic acid biosynthesis acetyltransferase WcaF
MMPARSFGDPSQSLRAGSQDDSAGLGGSAALPVEALDIAANRRARKYSRGELVRRVAWAAVWPLFRFSPRPAFAWRRMLLRLMGARVGARVHIYASATITYPWMLEIGDESAIGERALVYNLGRVTIGRRATISHQAHLCAGTHDYTDPALPLVKPPIVVGDEAWVCADAFVGPGVTVGAGAVVGARAVVLRDVEPWMVVVGNPARAVKRREIRRR